MVEQGLDHAKIPGEWYGVQTANEIFQDLSGIYKAELKVCSFKDGDIITRELLTCALGETYEQIL